MKRQKILENRIQKDGNVKQWSAGWEKNKGQPRGRPCGNPWARAWFLVQKSDNKTKKVASTGGVKNTEGKYLGICIFLYFHIFSNFLNILQKPWVGQPYYILYITDFYYRIYGAFTSEIVYSQKTKPNQAQKTSFGEIGQNRDFY